MTYPYLKTDGEIQSSMDGVLEHLEHMIGSMCRQEIIKVRPDKFNSRVMVAEDHPVGSPAYHAIIVYERLHRIWNSMNHLWGSTDGQLCPYEDCAHDLAIKESGWWQCPHCERMFWAEDSDSDYEDYHTYQAGEAPKEALLIEATGRVARDLGDSYASPKIDCEECKGTGKVTEKNLDCPMCDGIGKIAKD
jgi:hypothetical protein